MRRMKAYERAIEDAGHPKCQRTGLWFFVWGENHYFIERDSDVWMVWHKAVNRQYKHSFGWYDNGEFESLAKAIRWIKSQSTTAPVSNWTWRNITCQKW